MIYDTLKLSKALQTSFSVQQAETLAQALSDGALGDIATKSDLKDALSTLKTEMVKWIVGAIAFNLLGTIGIMVTVAELVLKSK